MSGEADSVVRVCSQSEVAPGSVKAFAVGDKTLAVYNIDGTRSMPPKTNAPTRQRASPTA
jgi:hypothetical protein